MARPKKVNNSCTIDFSAIPDGDGYFRGVVSFDDEICWKADSWSEDEETAIAKAKQYFKQRLAFLLR